MSVLGESDNIMVEFLSNFLTPKKSRSPSSNNRASPAFDFQFEIPENPVRFESPQVTLLCCCHDVIDKHVNVFLCYYVILFH